MFNILSYRERRASIWELIKDGTYVLVFNESKAMKADEAYKQRFKLQISNDPSSLLCAFCKTPVHFAQNNNPVEGSVFDFYFKHRPSRGDTTIEKRHQECPFFSENHSENYFKNILSEEGAWHFETKFKLGTLLRGDSFIDCNSVAIEKYIFSDKSNARRRPDLSFTDTNDQKWAIELLHSWMDAQLALERSEFYKTENTNLIWLLSPQCVEFKNAMFNLAVFGLSGTEYLKFNDPSHFNAYTVNDELLAKSKEIGNLKLNVIFPSFTFSKSFNNIEYELTQKIIHLSELTKDNNSVIPYYVNQKENYLAARKQLDGYELAEKLRIEKAFKAEQTKACDSIEGYLNELNVLADKYYDNPEGTKTFLLLIKNRLAELYSLISEENIIAKLDITQPSSLVVKICENIENYLNEKELKEEEKKSASRKSNLVILIKDHEELIEQFDTAISSNNFNFLFKQDTHITRVLKTCENYEQFELRDRIKSKRKDLFDKGVEHYSAKFKVLSEPIDFSRSYQDLLKEAFEIIFCNKDLVNVGNEYKLKTQDKIEGYRKAFRKQIEDETNKIYENIDKADVKLGHLRKVLSVLKYFKQNYELSNELNNQYGYLSQIYNERKFALLIK